MTRRASDPYLADLTAVTNAYAASDLDSALALTSTMRDRYPERATGVGRMHADVLACSGRPEQAMEVLANANDDGRWWSSRQLDDPDLATLASIDGYAGIRSAMQQAEADAIRRARASAPGVVVDAPEGGRPTATVVALHMHAVPAAETRLIWSSIVDNDFALVTVESTFRDADGLPTWDDADLAVRDVSAAVDAARRVGAPVVLAGGSQGAATAARLALSGEIGTVAGFVGVVGAPESWTVRSVVPGAMVVGGADLLVAAVQRRFQQEAVAAGVPVSLTEVPGLEHRYPDDWPDQAPGLVESLLG